MRAYLDELYLIIGYLESRQPRSIVRLTVSRSTHLILNNDVEGAAGEVARTQQELTQMDNDKSSKELSALLEPVRTALVRGSGKTALRALADIHLGDAPEDFSSIAREIRASLSSIDLDIARQ